MTAGCCWARPTGTRAACGSTSSSTWSATTWNSPGGLQELFEAKRKAAHLVTLQEMDDRPLPVRLRDGIARLLTPYL